ncbi:unnamed protein product [Dimorphilus gyrociliatus]|uniref:Uncharacterized protein n=1 Tax=Dimorphilus gyrociliatus TaxID=2664684 RepID=A0A7I8VW69_9ANNE|nr:unnamed protein product [Dimorphilus gyrociliatus]
MKCRFKNLIFISVVFSSFTYIFFLRSWGGFGSSQTNGGKYSIIQLLQGKSIVSPKRLQCVKDKLELWPEEIRKIYNEDNIEPMGCSSERDWIIVINGTLQVQVTDITDIQCQATPIVRVNDFTEREEAKITGLVAGSKIPSDFFRLDCIGRKDSLTKTFRTYYSAIKKREKFQKNKRKASRKKWNVLMFGFDSVSRMQWMRLLPQTHHYWTKVLNATVLESYNIVGDGTPQALLPILTGKTEVELPEARRGHADAVQVDNHPWIWKQFSNDGYVTQWGEDGQSFGTFQFRMLGFKDPPTDYYLRPFERAVHKKFCLGSVPTHKQMTNWIDELWRVYKGEETPKFSFLFHSVYTHGYTKQLSIADEDMKKWLKHLKDDNILKNTFVILMADHGPRFLSLRAHIQGKYEERNPYFSIRIPDDFDKMYPNARATLQQNANRLTTPFDIHATFEDILNFDPFEVIDERKRGLSILKDIPLDRTCNKAGIEAHWCSCLSWKKLKITDPLVTKSAESVISLFNSHLVPFSKSCSKLKLGSVISALKLEHNSDVLKFKKSSDQHGRVADLSDEMKADDARIRVDFITLPNNGRYEATVKLNLINNSLSADMTQISRINRYGKQPHCIMDRVPELRPICYCIVQLN